MSKLVDHNSYGSSISELDLFTVPHTQIAVDRGLWEEVQLTNSCTNEGPYEFRIPKDHTLLHINRNFIYMQLNIVDPDGTAIAAGAEVAPINLLGKTFFNNVKVKIGGKTVSNANNLYPYRAYLETELNYGGDAKRTHLQAAMYYRDEEGRMNTLNNTGYRKRKAHFAEGKTVELMAPIHCDLFEQDRYLVSNIDLQLELTRSTDAFLLMCPGADAAVPAYRIQVQTMRWFVRKVEVSKECFLGLELSLEKQPARYPIRRVEMTTVHVGQGRWATPTTALFSGQLPRRVLIACVDSDAYHGTYRKNPFEFKHYNITRAKVVAGCHSYPEPAYALDIEKDQYLRAYLGLYDTVGIERDDRGIEITRFGYVNGYTVLGFDMTPDCDDGRHWETVKDGSFSVHLEFDKPIEDPGVEVLIYAEYDSLLTIDFNRMPSADYAIG
jgi:hypothetical protein